MTKMNFDEHKEEITKDSLEELYGLLKEFDRVQHVLRELEDKLKLEKVYLDNLSRLGIPGILNKYGLSELKLSDGRKVIIEEKLKSSISEKNKPLAYKQMLDTESDPGSKSRIADLFKHKVIIYEESEEVLNILIDEGIEYEVKKDIHHSTLNKYCREKLASGEKIPEAIGVFQYQETKLK